MKKFLVAFLGIFLIFGSAVLVGCGKTKADIKLSSDLVSVQIHTDDEASEQEVITAEFVGGKNAEISAYAQSGYENIVNVNTSKISSNKARITIKGLQEGSATVAVRATPGNKVKYVYVDVYSEVSAMSQKQEDGKAKNFLIRGEENQTLEENKLISFEPSSKSRREITWSLADDMTNVEGLALTGNSISLTSEFSKAIKTVNLIATTEKGVSTPISLPVVDKIEEDVKLTFTNNKNAEFKEINKDYNKFRLVPNIESNEYYNGYVEIDYKLSDEFEITPVVYASNGKESKDIQVLKETPINENDDKQLYVIRASEGKNNINDDYKVGFKIGYKTVDYYIDTLTFNPFTIQAREMVKEIILSTDGSSNVNNSSQTLYTTYADSNTTNSHGQRFNVSILPTTVIDASHKYSIRVERTRTEQTGNSPLIDNNKAPVEIWYKDEINDAWQQINLIKEVENGQETGAFTTGKNEADMPSIRTLYIRGANLAVQKLTDYDIKFISQDNNTVSTSFQLNLVKSVESTQFIFQNAGFSIDSSDKTKKYEKEFTLNGQSSIDGLYIVYRGINGTKYVNFETLHDVTHTNDSVTFKVSLQLNADMVGTTIQDSYQIAHENGLISETFLIDIFLPLKYVTMQLDYDSENIGTLNSVVDYSNNNKVYSLSGEELTDQSSTTSLASLMLKNNTATPLTYITNSINGRAAVTSFAVRFLDYNPENGDNQDVATFKKLTDSKEGITKIIREAQASSNIVSFIDYYSTLLTYNVGYTYAVMQFSGKGIGENLDNGTVTYVRIVLIESFISPDGMNIVPDANKNIELFASNTVSSTEENLTTAKININFTRSGVTYNDIKKNLRFVSVMGEKVTDDNNQISWKNGSYTLTEVALTPSGITFNILALSTFGADAFADTLNVYYYIQDENKKLYEISTTINILIKNAQRIEEVKWRNYDEDGIYFEVGDKETQYLVFETSPTNARNKELAYYVADNVDNSFIEVQQTQIAENTFGVKLSDTIDKGTTGYLYVLPADAIYNGDIRYYYLQEQAGKTDKVEKKGSISKSELPTKFDELMKNDAYFKSNPTGGEAKEKPILLKNIILKIKITVADGSSFDYAYRVYDNDDFKNIKSDKFYTVMSNLDLTNETFTRLDSFTGGLQGANKDVTLKVKQNFTKSNNGVIQNLTFIGDISDNGNGFVADVNNSKITNVTIDTNGRKASTLTVTTNGDDTYVGGLVGENGTNGTLENCSVLGLTITASTEKSYVGGFAGKSSGTIKGCKVEFYNLESKEEKAEPEEKEPKEPKVTYAPNTFTGHYVGGFVGTIDKGTISNSYIYDYTIIKVGDSEGKTTYSFKDKNSNLKLSPNGSGRSAGAFVGMYTKGDDGSSSTIKHSFAVVNLSTEVGGDSQNGTNTHEGLTIEEYYISYANSSGNIYTSKIQPNENSDAFVESGDGFKEYVNGGKKHFKDLYQDPVVASVAEKEIKDFKENDFYKSLAVEKVGDNSQGILFLYELKNPPASFSSAEQNDLDKLNTISLFNLTGEQENRNIVITSSNENIVKVIGSSLKVIKTGEVTLTISSKQDASNLKNIYIKVINALSDMVISWVDGRGTTNVVTENMTMKLQKTKSRDFIISYTNEQVYLGSTATPYILEDNTIDINIIYNKESEEETTGEIIKPEHSTQRIFKVLTTDKSIKTKFSVVQKAFEVKENVQDEEKAENERNTKYQEAIKKTFERHFVIEPVEGVISFELSNNTLSITPSTNAVLTVKISTTDTEDTIMPHISYNGNDMSLLTNENENVFDFALLGSSTPILQVTVTPSTKHTTSVSDSGVQEIYFDVLFAVTSSYRDKIKEEMEFSVYFTSKNESSSKDLGAGGGEFKLVLTTQNMNNIDLTNKFVRSPHFDNVSGNIIEVYPTGEPTAILAPGQSSILEVNVNPEYAYYDYAQITYSGTPVSNAVNIDVMEKYGNNEFIRIRDNSVEEVGGVLRYTPTENKGRIYYKLWINTTVDRDITLKFTISFYLANETLIQYVNYYLTISYLSEPRITIDGSSVAYVAKGTSAQIKVEVLADQTLNGGLVLETTDSDATGVEISTPSKPQIDNEKGIKTYTANIYAPITATTATYTLSANISREINGQLETTKSIMTIYIVDFTVSDSGVTINGQTDRNVVIWQGVDRPLTFQYTINPESYGLAPDTETQAEINRLLVERELFANAGFYPAKEEGGKFVEPGDLDKNHYFINYNYESVGGKFVHKSLKDRLFVVTNAGRQGIDNVINGSIDVPFTASFDGETNTIRLTGTRLSSTPIRMVLETYLSFDGKIISFDTEFNITVTAFSDPDLPILIKNTTEFNNLNPISSSTQEQNDYILANDLLLENYNSFNTDLIRSLDGNGYTIYIKSFDMTGSGALNLALFNTVSEDTVLKNIRVNIYNGGQLSINVAQFTDINVAGLAIENEGVITNCEVVSFFTENTAVGPVLNSIEGATVAHSGNQGINITYTRGNNTEPVKLHDVGSSDSEWSSNVAGFVVNNRGSITNSRVGGKEITILGNEKKIDGRATGTTYASYQKLDTFYIIAQGNIAGFVLNNSNGNISSSYVQQVDMDNQSESTQYYISGFVGQNSATINECFIEGVCGERIASNNAAPIKAFKKTSIKASKACIAGFVYKNEKNISDSYSNILIANPDTTLTVYLASGFVYENTGTIENAYSASQILNGMLTQMNFSGVDRDGNLLANGKYINCYYYNESFDGLEDTFDTSTERMNNTGAVLVSDPTKKESFYGFSVSSGDEDGVWRVSEEDGCLSLISTRTTALSHRYIYYVENPQGMTTGEDENGEYVLPYAILSYTDTIQTVDTSLGGDSNPIIITDAQDFIDAMGTSKSVYVQEYFNNSSVWGNYRLINDIDLASVANGDNNIILPSSSKAFSGKLAGNNFTISNISIAADNLSNVGKVAFGLFASIEKKTKGNSPIIRNINLDVNRIEASTTTFVGALAGYVKDAVLVSIDLNFAEEATITGENFVGGLSGLISGNNILRNITVSNANVVAKKYSSSEDNNAYFTIAKETAEYKLKEGQLNLKNFRLDTENNLDSSTLQSSKYIQSIKEYSYAGALVGYADIYSVSGDGFNIDNSENYNVNNIRISGTTYVEAQVAGGVFGLTGYATNVNDIGITFDKDSRVLATKFFAGGISGQSFGSIRSSFAVYDDETQKNIENNIGAFYKGNNNVERGSIDIFRTATDTSYSQQYIGGLVGMAMSGKIEISYSKLNVTASSAEYAGGLIGCADLRFADNYLVSLSDDQNFLAKLYLHEVFATGDVRGKTFAGGIVGKLVSASGANANLLLHGVNALNYFTTYDYEKNTYTDIQEQNLSLIIHANAFVGQIFESEVKKDAEGKVVSEEFKEKEFTTTKIWEGGTTEEPSEADKKTQYTYEIISSSEDTAESKTPSLLSYENYINFIYAEDESERDNLPVASYYLSYYDKDIPINLFSNISGQIGQDETNQGQLNPLYDDSYIMPITNPKEFTTSGEGHESTQVGFLGSGVWSNNNWEHPAADLFPSIRYKQTSTLLYLDAYYSEDTKKIFNTINDPESSSDYTLIIRGRASETANYYTDVDFTAWGDDAIKQFKNFAGRLKGGVFKNLEGEDIKIITDRPLIQNALVGFVATNVSVEFKSGEFKDNSGGILLTTAGVNADNTGSGLFIANPARQISINGLTMSLQNPVTMNTDGASSKNSFGLIAPSLESSSVTNVKIKNENGLSGVALSVNYDEATDDLYVGLVAGQMTQSSLNQHIYLSGVDIEGLDKGLIQIEATKTTETSNIYVGGYVGAANRVGSAPQKFYVDLASIAFAEGTQNTNRTDSSASTTKHSINIQAKGNIFAGGYIGATGVVETKPAEETTGTGTTEQKSYWPVSSITISQEINSTIDFEIPNAAKNLTLGGILGKVSGGLANLSAPTGGSNTLDVWMDIQDSVTNLNAGGLVGEIGGNESAATGTTTFSGFGTINFGLFNSKNSEDADDKISFETQKNKLDSTGTNYSNDAAHSVTVSGTANIGGVVGHTTGKLSISNISEINPINPVKEKLEDGTTKSHEEVYSVRVTGGKQNIGSLVGYAANTATTSISGGTTSYMEIYVDNGSANVGGMIGRIDAFDNAGTEEAQSLTIDGNPASGIQYNGAVYSNVSNLKFGGMVGNWAADATTSGIGAKASIKNTSFGGVVKIYGANPNYDSGKDKGTDKTITTGGTIGATPAVKKENSSSATLDLSNNYNYGDVFVEYNNNGLNQLEAINFGGLVGASGTTTYNASDNYSLTTIHDYKADRSNTNGTISALFGGGVTKDGSYSNNYYNSGVTLCVDTNGTDATAYGNSNYHGYEREKDSKLEGNIVEKIKELAGAPAEGAKLNPYKTSTEGSGIKTDNVFNGMVYYMVDGSIQDFFRESTITKEDTSDPSKTTEKTEATNLNNVAIIGDGTQINYTNKLSTITTDGQSPFGKLSGFSYIAGLALDIDINFDVKGTIDKKTENGQETETERQDREIKAAGLVGEMDDNSTIYAVNVKGSLNIGGHQHGIVAGLVAKMGSGRISECSTDIDITYRGADNTSPLYGVYGLAKVNSISSIIENSYTAGLLTTYISSNVYAFANATGTVKNCYTIAKFNMHDYTRSDDTNQGQKHLFGKSDDSLYFDYDAIENKSIDKDGEAKTYQEFANIFENSICWNARDYNFNYGYPTLKYGFLKPSSYFTQSAPIYQGTSGYDAKVITYTYERLKNGETVPQKTDEPAATDENTSTECYYAIPNAAVLTSYLTNKDETTGEATPAAEGSTSTIDGKYFLKYNIDLDKLNAAKTVMATETLVVPGESDETIITGGVDDQYTFSGKFDGHGNTISGLKTSLFKKIKGGASSDRVVSNLRLTKADIIDGVPILAEEITNATISNMTLSGTIKNSAENSAANDDFGALARKLNNAKIDTITNMTQITLKTGKDNTNVGGLAGSTTGATTIDYSSNYGPVNVADNTTGSLAVNVGGLVGQSSDTTIQYSYNATSVLNNYATTLQLNGDLKNTDGTCKTIGNFYTGGIVGKGSADIKDCYNSGMVKSGNKANGETKQNLSDKSYYADGTAYAGGIIGCADSGEITACYNEGTVEALGANPDTSWQWERLNISLNGEISAPSSPSDPIYLTLKQTSQRNVWAYAIGYGENGASFSGNSVKLAAKTTTAVGKNSISGNSNEASNDVDKSTINPNGSALDAGDVFWYRGWSEGVSLNANSDNSSSCTQSILAKLQLIDGTTPIYKNIEFSFRRPGNKPDSTHRARGAYIKFEPIINAPIDANTKSSGPITIDENNGFKEVKDNLNIPMSVKMSLNLVQVKMSTAVVTHQYQDTSTFSYNFQKDIDNDYANLTWSDITTSTDLHTAYQELVNQYAYYSFAYENDKDHLLSNREGTSQETRLQNVEKIVTETNDAIKNNSRSSTTTSTSMTTIDGKTYYLGEGNNINTVLNAGINTATFGFSADVPYLTQANPNKIYTITSDDFKEGSTSITITSISPNAGGKGTEFTCSLNTTASITAETTLNLHISYAYSENINIDLSNLTYYYIDDSSLGIECDELKNGLALTNYKLKDGETEHTQIYRLSNKESGNIDATGHELADNSANYIYLYKYEDAEENNIYVYKQNLTLVNLKNETIPVNKPISVNGGETLTYKVTESEEGSTNNIEQVQEFIKKMFKDQKWYLRSAVNGSETAQISILPENFKQYATKTETVTFGKQDTGTGSVGLGSISSQAPDFTAGTDDGDNFVFEQDLAQLFGSKSVVLGGNSDKYFLGKDEKNTWYLNKEEIANYLFEDSGKHYSETQEAVEIDVDAAGAKLVLKINKEYAKSLEGTTPASDDTGLKEKINNWLNQSRKITYYYNDTTVNVEQEITFGNISSSDPETPGGTQKTTISVNNGASVEINWNYNLNDIKFSANGNSWLTVEAVSGDNNKAKGKIDLTKLTDTNKQSATFVGKTLTLYKGELTLSATRTVGATLNDYCGYINLADRQVEIKILKDDKVIATQACLPTATNETGPGGWVKDGGSTSSLDYGQYKVDVTCYATYKRYSESITENTHFKLLVADPQKVNSPEDWYYIDVTFDDAGAPEITSISRLYKDSKEDKYLYVVAEMFESAPDETTGETTKEIYYYSVYEKDKGSEYYGLYEDLFLRYDIAGNANYAYYNDKGLIKENEEEFNGEKVTNNNKIYAPYLSKYQISQIKETLDYTYFNLSVEKLVKQKDFEDFEKILKITDNNSYLTINGNYQIILGDSPESINSKNKFLGWNVIPDKTIRDVEKYKIYTQVANLSVEYVEQSFPDYTPATTNYREPNLTFDKFYQTASSKLYTAKDSKITVYLRDFELAANYKYEANMNNNETPAATTGVKLTTLKPGEDVAGIILVGDVRMSGQTASYPSIRKNNIKLSGNDYYISYFDDGSQSLYQQGDPTEPSKDENGNPLPLEGFISKINLLAETDHSIIYSVTKVKDNNGKDKEIEAIDKLVDVSFYGCVTNMECTNPQNDCMNIIMNSRESSVDLINVKSYAAANSYTNAKIGYYKNESEKDPATAPAKDTFNNLGVIDAADGKNGNSILSASGITKDEPENCHCGDNFANKAFPNCEGIFTHGQDGVKGDQQPILNFSQYTYNYPNYMQRDNINNLIDNTSIKINIGDEGTGSQCNRWVHPDHLPNEVEKVAWLRVASNTITNNYKDHQTLFIRYNDKLFICFDVKHSGSGNDAYDGHFEAPALGYSKHDNEDIVTDEVLKDLINYHNYKFPTA